MHTLCLLQCWIYSWMSTYSEMRRVGPPVTADPTPSRPYNTRTYTWRSNMLTIVWRTSILSETNSILSQNITMYCELSFRKRQSTFLHPYTFIFNFTLWKFSKIKFFLKDVHFAHIKLLNSKTKYLNIFLNIHQYQNDWLRINFDVLKTTMFDRKWRKRLSY